MTWLKDISKMVTMDLIVARKIK